ncbi:MAG: diacetylchitobiose deacetylase [Thermodesulfobacteriota bacterium]|nr:MAG: diacetylchitobiose deacetylase [Thermodesulfobacteriota bacterium]
MSKTILVVSPHPDDLEIGMGGTAAKLIDEGTNVISLIATDGSGSTTTMELSGEEMAEVRRQEAREAVSVLGIQTLIPLTIENVKTDKNKQHFKNDFKEAILRFKPQEIYIPHPEIDKHPTHKAISELVVDELRDGNFKPEKVWCYEVWTPFSSYDRIEDITKYIDLKVMAIETHRSQLEYKNYTEGIIGLNRYRAVFDERHGVTKEKYAEVFIQLEI